MSWLERASRVAYARWFAPRSLVALARGGLTVGRNVTLMTGVTIDPSHLALITIGDDVTIARDTLVLAHDASTKLHLGYTRIGKVSIGDRVFIGAKSVVLPGVRIGNDVVIGAGSVVARDIPDGTVAAGVPAKRIASLGEWLERRSRELESSPRFVRDYTQAGGVSPAMMGEMCEAIGDGVGYIV